MTPFSPIPSRHPIRVVLSSPALQRFISVRNAAALVIAQLGIAAFFVPGIMPVALGESAGWFVLAATGLAALVRDFAAAGKRAVAVIETGDPAHRTLQLAEEREADLIVVGNKGLGSVKRFLLGNVPSKVVHNSPCSTHVVHTA